MSTPDLESPLDHAVPDRLDPAEAFAILGNETRIHILQALWRATDRPIAFSELRRRVEMRDSAQFNYHLGKLTDHFVKRTDDGYDFRYAGEKVVRAILAGTFTEHVSMDLPVPEDCHDCGGALHATYHDEQLGIACEDCGATYGRYAFPPGGLKDRSTAEVLRAFDQRVRHLHCLAADGVCPECSGRMQTTVRRDDEDVLDLDVRVDHECRQCRHVVTSPVGLSLLDTSAVVAFYDEQGVDLGMTPHWTLPWCVRDDTTTVRSWDPVRVEVVVPGEDTQLRVTLDGDLAVVDTAREPLASQL
jgi:hypothetical protein